MRVAIIKSGEHIDMKIERILNANKIDGDFIEKFNYNSFNLYDSVIFTYKNNIPNLPKVIEQIVLENRVIVIFINNTFSIGKFYNVLNNLYFNIINEQTLDIELLSILYSSNRYISEINRLKNENSSLKEQIETINLTNFAKRILMNKGLNEAESHQFIQKMSMNLRLSKRMTVLRIIENNVDF